MAPTPVSRVTRSRAEARANYDRLSRWYDVLAGPERRFSARGVQLLRVEPAQTVLEIGFGTGHALLHLAKMTGPAGAVFGIDLSPGMLGVARRRVGRAGQTNCVHLALADAIHLPFPAASFAALFMGFALELFDTPEIPTLLRECRRVLRPGGRVAVVSLAKRDRDGLMVRFSEWTHRRFPRLVDCRPIWVAASLEEAGFRVVDQEGGSLWGLPVDVVVATAGA